MNTALIVVLCVHILVCAVMTVWILQRKSVLPRSFLPIVLFVPVFGVLSALTVESILRRGKDGKEQIDEMLARSDLMLGTVITVEADPAVVPLEEAMLINDAKTRRTIMTGILRRNPQEYLDVLKIARQSDDVEVTHYATTTIIEIERAYELKIARQSEELDRYPDDIGVLDVLIETLRSYIGSGLPEVHQLSAQRLRVASLLKKRIALNPSDKQPYFYAMENDIDLGQYHQAEGKLKALLAKWPTDENVWLSGLRLYAASGDIRKKQQLLKTAMAISVEWTAKGKERMRFWCGKDAFDDEKSLARNRV